MSRLSDLIAPVKAQDPHPGYGSGSIIHGAIFLLLVLVSGCLRAPEAQQGQVRFLDSNHQVLATVAVEIADTPVKQARGLMGRRLPDDRHGMLFVFENAAPRVFWMHNTPGPLDMIFMDEKGRVLNIVENAEPYSRQHLPSKGPSRYVVEVPGGFAARHHIVPGVRMEIQPINMLEPAAPRNMQPTLPPLSLPKTAA